MKSEFFPEPTDERWQEISDAFRICSHFPNCLGAIDGKHIRVTKFPRSSSMNLNYKCYFLLFSQQMPIQITTLHTLTLKPTFLSY